MNKEEARELKIIVHELFNSLQPLIYDAKTEEKLELSKKFNKVMEYIDEKYIDVDDEPEIKREND